MGFRHAIIAALAGLILLATACGGASRFGAVEESLSKEVGVLTYAEAVDRWGKPTSTSPGQTMFTAYWLKERSGGIVKERLYLTFDNEKKILRAYRYTSKPFE
ncbi:MAG: hypothetical protein KMY53_03195 [Desulfarculus sp.]|nr:hypothetical protein [Pseudomonadota bacterium]MBV1714525.1 hypothetical protein [Desulfarculus sp.]MBU4576402.1 hypothetical protein [Pseudomonadota bacterium]MBU4599861.1 hypothetical protein [Pseudomonadota bacterium]MBV1737146.1 hypothetical protein [Desulfarculus sp.]